MTDAVLVLNAGSSSIKFSIYDVLDGSIAAPPICAGLIENIGHVARFSAHDAAKAALADESLPGTATHETAIERLLSWIDERFADRTLVAAGHRVVHGGIRYDAPVLIDAAVIEELRRLVPLAPLHQPHHIAAIEALVRLHPGLPQIACFDTAFHRSQPDIATRFAIPRALSEQGVRRYGFHGLSYEYIAAALPDVAGATAASGRVVVAHLGAGASLCAMVGGSSVATTMGFTALDGLPMARRCGAIDPGVLLYLMTEKGMDAAAISHMLYFESGLLGVSGISDDMRELLASRTSNAAEAIDLFVYRIGREIGSLAAAMGGLDALVFTAGIGEHSPEIRQRVMAQAAWLGLAPDSVANQAGGPCLTRPGSAVSAWAIATDEELMIARHSCERAARTDHRAAAGRS